MRRLILLLAVACLAPAADRTRYSLNPEWRVLAGDAPGAEAPGFDDSHWASITLRQAQSAAWCRKRFKLPAASAGRKIFLEFQGLGGEFYLNGKLLGRQNSATSLGFDVTATVKPAPTENVLVAHLTSSSAPNVWLHVTSRLHQTLPLYSSLGTTGVYIYAEDFDIAGESARITAEAQVKNEFEAPRTFTYTTVIQDIEGRTVATLDGGTHTLRAGQTADVKASGMVSKLRFWSWGYGYLYTVSTVLKVNGQAVDTVATRTGFRKTEFAGGAMKLNDRAIQLKGYAQNSADEWPIVGSSVPAWLADFSNRMIVDGNGDLVQWTPGMPSRQDVESCDRVGLMEAIALDAATPDAILSNRNNPSIVFYQGAPDAEAAQHKFDPHGGRILDGGQLPKFSAMDVGPMRIPKDEYFINQVKWDGWVEPEHLLARILGHWTNQPGAKPDVRVLSNADRVELRLNNQSLGNGQKADGFLFTFPNVEWREGTLQAVAYDANGRRAATARMDSAGPPAYIALNLRTGHNGLMADGSDLALVDVEVMDGYGRRCPLAANRVHLSVAGPAKLLGDADVTVEDGIRRVFLRATNQAGRIVLQANSDGLQLGVIDLLSRPAPLTAGLSTEPQGDDLTPYLGKGPTSGSAATSNPRR